MGGGHGAAPDKLVLPPEGDPYPPQSEWLDESGTPATVDYPDEYKQGLKIYMWQNYNDKPLPDFFPSPEQNMRMWQDMHIERMIDSQPTHEIHPSQLPEYHYWPMIQNDRENKFTGQVSTLVQYQYHADQTEIPRFHKNGIPKTPPQEQIWHTPLDENGRCNWRAIVARHLGHESFFSKVGWADRFYRPVYVDSLFQFRNGMKLLKVSQPILYKHRELNKTYRLFRSKKAGYRNSTPLYGWAFYFWLIGGTAAATASYADLVWTDDPWNYDMHYMKYYRTNGSYHSPV